MMEGFEASAAAENGGVVNGIQSIIGRIKHGGHEAFGAENLTGLDGTFDLESAHDVFVAEIMGEGRGHDAAEEMAEVFHLGKESKVEFAANFIPHQHAGYKDKVCSKTPTSRWRFGRAPCVRFHEHLRCY